MVRITEELVRKKSEHNERLISTLEELSLHQEDIERIEHIQNWCRDLKILLLQSNLIARLENLHKLKRLEYLNVAINNIERIENLESLESLNKLDLTLNFIGELTSVESLRGNYNLRELVLIGNPCVDYPHYRDFVLATLPQLHSLDCTEIVPSARLQAQRLLAQHRAIVVQCQTAQAIERDEQRIRVAEQQAELAKECAGIDDEEERVRAFWNAKSEHCPEVRTEIARQHKLGKERHPSKPNPLTEKPKRTTKLFAPCGRPYNLNQAKLTFKFEEEPNHYSLLLEVYKHLDTSHIDVDIQMNYVRVTVKGKIFQIAYSEEVKPHESVVQRSQITGHLQITIKKLKSNELLSIKSSNPSGTKRSSAAGQRAPLGIVDIGSICAPPDLPDLI
ncbi:protein tilB [Drosophila grimshawi]|uniref:GH17707 n=1 Tax=Drosophila grimshawi TaxID=7222 RepID=B4JWR5_DROGR|nr:protein tilB [Drosophila grimshawi]EDV95191.1 GH17707 [Drosophila grimshawi]